MGPDTVAGGRVQPERESVAEQSVGGGGPPRGMAGLGMFPGARAPPSRHGTARAEPLRCRPAHAQQRSRGPWTTPLDRRGKARHPQGPRPAPRPRRHRCASAAGPETGDDDGRRRLPRCPPAGDRAGRRCRGRHRQGPAPIAPLRRRRVPAIADSVRRPGAGASWDFAVHMAANDVFRCAAQFGGRTVVTHRSTPLPGRERLVNALSHRLPGHHRHRGPVKEGNAGPERQEYGRRISVIPEADVTIARPGRAVCAV